MTHHPYPTVDPLNSQHVQTSHQLMDARREPIGSFQYLFHFPSTGFSPYPSPDPQPACMQAASAL